MPGKTEERESDLRRQGWTGGKTGKMIDIGGGRMVEQEIWVPPPSSRDKWPHYTPRPQPEVCTIYFIGPENGPVKIGFAVNLSKRLRDLELANAYPLKVWASVEASPALEREYHARFAAHRLHGEWFTRCPEIEAEIARLSA